MKLRRTRATIVKFVSADGLVLFEPAAKWPEYETLHRIACNRGGGAALAYGVVAPPSSIRVIQRVYRFQDISLRPETGDYIATYHEEL